MSANACDRNYYLIMNKNCTEITAKIDDCLDKLYEEEKDFSEKNLSERCLVFRFAHYLQNEFGNDYFVDCDYNSSVYQDPESGEWKKRNGKLILDQRTGALKKRFIDVIVHKRGPDASSDFICFEFKKWNNSKPDAVRKDENNLKVLTSQYGYQFGFHLTFAKERSKVGLKIFNNGDQL